MGRDFPGGPVIKNPPSNAGDEVWCLVKKLRSHTTVCLLKSLQSCTILCDPLDCNLPGFSVHGVLPARILEWVAMPFSRGSSWPRDRTHVSCVSCTADGFFTSEPPGRPQGPTHCGGNWARLCCNYWTCIFYSPWASTRENPWAAMKTQYSQN